jgi:uncharacterized protein (TIGR00369 family)
MTPVKQPGATDGARCDPRTGRTGHLRPGYTKAVGTRVESAEAGYVVMSLAKTDNLLQANGFFHGGVIAGLADHAAGGAVTTAMPPGRFAVTVNLQVSFLAPAKGTSLVARARALQVGSTIGVARVDVASVTDGRRRRAPSRQ